MSRPYIPTSCPAATLDASTMGRFTTLVAFRSFGGVDRVAVFADFLHQKDL